MTAPAIPQLPQTVNDHAPYAVDDALHSIASESIAAALAERPDENAQEPQRDEKGRFLPKDGKPAEEEGAVGEIPAVPAVEPLTPDAPPGEPVPEAAKPVVLPEGMVAVPKIEGRDLATTFSVLDKDGELEPPDVTIKFMANGKERTEPLDKVVRLAQMGVYNAERDREITQTKQDAQQALQRAEQITQYARQLEAERERLLSDDTAYLTERAKYEARNTPEARVLAAQEQVQQAEFRTQFMQVAQQGQTFMERELEPAVETIVKMLPTVDREEIAARLLLVSDRYKVHTALGSIIPPTAYQPIRDAILKDIVPWAQQVHESRDTDRKTAQQRADTEKAAAEQKAKAAQVEAQKARNLVGRQAKPGQQRSTGNEQQPPKRQPKTVEDFESDAIASAIADTLAGR